MPIKDMFHQVVHLLSLISWLITAICTLTLLIVISSFWRRQCRSVLNLLMCNSSASLLCFALTYSLQTPYLIRQLYFNAPPPSALYCRITGCLATFGTIIAAYSCIVQAVSRFFITVLYQHRVLLTFRTNWLLILASWTASGTIAAAMLLSPSAYQYESESRCCTLTSKNTVTSSIAAGLFVGVTLIILVTLYALIVQHTVRHTRINPHSSSTLRARRNKRVFQNIIFSVSVHALSSLPYLVCIILNGTAKAPWPLYSISGLFFSIASAIHAIFLVMLNNEVKKILHGRFFANRITALMTVTKKNRVTPSPGGC